MSSPEQLARTIEISTFVPEPTSGSGAAVALVEAPVAGQPDESLQALRQRLRMVCGVVIAGFLAFFLRQILVENVTEFMKWNWSAAFLCLAISAAILTIPRTPRRGTLRLAELLIFGQAAWFFAATIHYSVRIHANPDDMPWAIFNLMLGTTWFCALAFTYAMVMPGSWRRVAVVVSILVAVPIAVMLYDRWQYPLFANIVNFNMVTLIVLMLATCGTALVFWSYRFAQLQREAAQARRFGQYRLKELIGSGGMGEVFLAEHTLLKRPCALKRIRPGQDTDPVTLARFEREVRATAKLSHPHTVEIYDYGRASDGTFYYVMEYLWGLTLEDLVMHHGSLPPARAIYLLRQVCDALEEAHAAALIHRDIKPGNIFAARRGGEFDFVKLLDFGLVKVAAPEHPALSRADTVVGSPLYMSPEQSSGEQLPDARADVYSLGAVGYFLVTGHPPFQGEHPMAVMIAHARDPVRPPSQLVGDLPADLEAVLVRCLCKDPNQRFPTAAALGEALASCSAAGSWTRADAANWWQTRPAAAPRGTATTG